MRRQPPPDPTPAPRGRVPVVVLARFKTVPSPTTHWQPGGPAKSHQKEAAVARIQHLGADGAGGGKTHQGRTLPAGHRAQPTQASPALGESWVGRARRLPRGQPTSRPGSPDHRPSLGTRAGTTPPRPCGRGRLQAGEERRGSGESLEGSTPGQTPAGPREGLPTGSPVPSATGPLTPLPAVRPFASLGEGWAPLPGERLGLPELLEIRS